MRRLEEARAKAPGKRARGYAIALLAILALAAFLRFYDLGEESLWVDEIYSLSFVSASDAAQVVSLTYAEDYHPPGYHLILYYGTDETGVNASAAPRTYSTVPTFATNSCNPS